MEPTGVEYKIEIKIPSKAQHTEMTTEQITTLLKLSKILIADKDGKIISADMSKAPTRFIPSTIITAIITAIKKNYICQLLPLLLLQNFRQK